MFSDKSVSKNKIALLEDDEIVTNELAVAEVLNAYFTTITDSLGINENRDIISNADHLQDHIDKIFHSYSDQPSIKELQNYLLMVLIAVP